MKPVIHKSVLPVKSEVPVVTSITTTYLPAEDITVVWQHLSICDEVIQRSLIGFYYGEPDESATESFSNMPLTAQFL